MKRSMIREKSIDFALLLIDLYGKLQGEREYVISKQFLRSGTSIGANVSEALAGESRADFVHKMAVSSKEARETLYWLELLNRSQLVALDYSPYIERCEELVKILTSIVKSSKR